MTNITTKDTIVIFGSSRARGDTWELLQKVCDGRNLPIIELNARNISYFDYEHANKNDDFLPIIEEIIQYKQILLATPIYWYSMSGQMKVFFDRLTDCITIRQDLGRQLSGRKVFLIMSRGQPTIPPCAEMPIKLTCEYMKMPYGGCLHYSKSIDEKKQLEAITQFQHQVFGT